MEKKSFKKKLTLSTSSSTQKRSDKIRYAKSQNKNSVIIEKKILDQDLEKQINNLVEIRLDLLLKLVKFLIKI